MAPRLKKDCLSSLGQIAELDKTTSKLFDKAGKGQQGTKNKRESLEKFPQASVRRPKAKGKPGRKRLDKKTLQEKIDKLKMLTRSINKTTVR